jgi:hypothetical protein
VILNAFRKKTINEVLGLGFVCDSLTLIAMRIGNVLNWKSKKVMVLERKDEQRKRNKIVDSLPVVVADPRILRKHVAQQAQQK